MCLIQGCDTRGRNKGGEGLCEKHYYRQRRNGSPDTLLGPARQWKDPETSDFGYVTAHQRIQRRRGKATEHPCARCGEQAMDWALTGEATHSEPYRKRRADGSWYERLIWFSKDPDDYSPLCRPCHRRSEREPSSDCA
jgi:hypothetical protein